MIKYNIIIECSSNTASKNTGFFKNVLKNNLINKNIENKVLQKYNINGVTIYSYGVCETIINSIYQKILLTNYNTLSFNITKYNCAIGNKFNYTHPFYHFIGNIVEFNNIFNNVLVGFEFSKNGDLPNFEFVSDTLIKGSNKNQFISKYVIFYDINLLVEMQLNDEIKKNSDNFINNTKTINIMTEVIKNSLKLPDNNK